MTGTSPLPPSPFPERPLPPRHLVVFVGTPDSDFFTRLRMRSLPTTGIWIGASAPDGYDRISPREVAGLLGSEHPLAVLDSRQGLEPDALGIIAGCIPSNGILILLVSDPVSNAASQSPFHQRLFHLLGSFAEVIHLNSETGSISSLIDCLPPCSTYSPPLHLGRVASPDQALAIEAVEHVLQGQRRKPVLLTADRGRGKSAAMGTAAGRILKQREVRILVTGRNRSSVEVVFRHALLECPRASQYLHWADVDTVIADQPTADLLLVDEAAGIPLNRLALLLTHYPRIAMATTVHGYEGSGRGFLLKFRKILDRHSRGWRSVTLHQPIRWGPDDPLENIVNRLLLLDVELPALPDQTEISRTHIDTISGQELVRDEEELRTIFSLLITAHYRTRPRDLRHLLDHEGLVIHRLRCSHSGISQTIGVLLAIQEPAPKTDLGREIALGRRRTGKHVLAEVLAGQLGIRDAVTLELIRIQRIVIHPRLHRQGFGTRLLQQFCEDQRHQFSMIGTQFALSSDLVRFWRRAGFIPVRVGTRASRFAGTVSGLFLWESEHAENPILSVASMQFRRQFPASLLRTHRDLEAEIVLELLERNSCFSEPPDEQDLVSVAGFCLAGIPESSIPESIHRTVIWGLSIGKLPDRLLCIEHILQARDWKECRNIEGDEGKKSGTSRIRWSCTQLLSSHANHALTSFAADHVT